MPETGLPQFEPLVAAAKAKAVVLAREDRISLDDARFLLRALEDLEADGVELFNRQPATREGLGLDIESYLGARVGLTLARQLLLVTFQSAEVSK